MSNIKNPAPFFTLKEAAKELNRVLNFNYYDSKKLLHLALVYDLKLHTYFYGDFNVFVDLSCSISPLSDGDKYLEIIRITEEIVKTEMTWGVLLEIEYYALQRIALFGKAETRDYGFCNITNLKMEALNQSNFLSHTDLKRKYLKYIEEEKINEIKILAIYPMLESISEKESSRPKKYNVFETDDGQFIYHPMIRKKDVCITHNQLLRILNSELCIRDNATLDQQDSKNKHQFSKPTGKSKAKENAQIAAKTLADYLWRQDKDKKTRISEMAINVYAELYQTEHQSQLPENQQSLESWITDVADKYPHSRLPGRKKKG